MLFAAVTSMLRRPSLRFLILVFFVIIFAFAGMETTFALWAMAQFGWGPRPVTYIFAFVGVLGAVVQGGLIGRLVKRFGEERVLIAGTSLIVGGLILQRLDKGGNDTPACLRGVLVAQFRVVSFYCTHVIIVT